MITGDMRRLRTNLRLMQRELAPISQDAIYECSALNRAVFSLLPELYAHLEAELAYKAQQARLAAAAVSP